MATSSILHRSAAYRAGLAAHLFDANPYPPRTFNAAAWALGQLRANGAGDALTFVRGATQ